MTSDLHIAKPHSPFLVLFFKLSAHFTPSFSKHFLHLVSRTSISCDSLSATLPLVFSVLHLLTLVPQSSVLGIILFCIYFTSWMIISPYSVSKCHLYSDNPQIYHSNQDLSLKSRLLSTSTFLTSPLGCLNGTFRPNKSKPNSWFPHLKHFSHLSTHFGNGDSILLSVQTGNHPGHLLLSPPTHQPIL